MTQEVKPKKIKSSGPIRFEALLPTAVIIGLIYAYFALFFDMQLKKTLELIGYNVAGAEVNIGSLNTSFWKASISIRDIQITNSERPTHNIVQIGDIRFSMLWDALLRGKIVINEAAIEQILASGPRKTPGKIKPPEPPTPASQAPSALEKEATKLSQEAIEKTQEKYSENILGDIAALMGGSNTDVQVQNLEAKLKSKARMAEIEKMLKEKQESWAQKQKTLPQGKEIEALGLRLSQVKTKDFKSPQELQNSLQQIQAIIKEGDDKLKLIQAAGSELEQDLKILDRSFKELDDLVKQDLKDLEAHFRLPSLDGRAIAYGLFYRYADPYLQKFKYYDALAKKYLPPNLVAKKNGDEKETLVKPRPRALGVSYEFGKPNSYPFFWLKRAGISSVHNPAIPASGNIKGEITNIASNSKLTQKPMVFAVQGDFPGLSIMGLDIQLILDHVKEPFKRSFKAALASYPVGEKMFVSSQDVEIGFNQATGRASLIADFIAGETKIAVNNTYSQVSYKTKASNADVDQILNKVFAGISMININIDAQGRFPNLPLNITSNLGEELKKGFQREIQAKVDEAKLKLKKAVDDIILAERTKLEAQYTHAKAQVQAEVQKLQSSINQQKADAEKRATQAQKDAEAQAKKAAEQELKKVLGDDAEKKLQDLKKQLRF